MNHIIHPSHEYRLSRRDLSIYVIPVSPELPFCLQWNIPHYYHVIQIDDFYTYANDHLDIRIMRLVDYGVADYHSVISKLPPHITIVY
jgi:hypothetical protein